MALICVCIYANDCVFTELTLQLLSSSAVKMMLPHFFPGIPLEGRKKEKESSQRLIRDTVSHNRKVSASLCIFYCNERVCVYVLTENKWQCAVKEPKLVWQSEKSKVWKCELQTQLPDTINPPEDSHHSIPHYYIQTQRLSVNISLGNYCSVGLK